MWVARIVTEVGKSSVYRIEVVNAAAFCPQPQPAVRSWLYTKDDVVRERAWIVWIVLVTGHLSAQRVQPSQASSVRASPQTTGRVLVYGHHLSPGKTLVVLQVCLITGG